MTNTVQAEAWDGPEGAKWVRFQNDYDTALAAHAQAVLDAAGLAPGERVLDIGCGCGSLTRTAARALGASGHATGADLSTEMLARGREAATTEGVGNIDFVRADVQTHAFDSRYDVAISRFGVMFFDNPAAAFANVARALTPDGRVAFVVWRPMADNPWMSVARDAFLVGRDIPPPAEGVPGPYGLATTDLIHAGLDSSFGDVNAAAQSMKVNIGRDVDAGSAFVCRTGHAAFLLEGLDDSQRASGFDRLRTALEPHATPAGVLVDSAVWIVTGRRLAS